MQYDIFMDFNDLDIYVVQVIVKFLDIKIHVCLKSIEVLLHVIKLFMNSFFVLTNFFIVFHYLIVEIVDLDLHLLKKGKYLILHIIIPNRGRRTGSSNSKVNCFSLSPIHILKAYLMHILLINDSCIIGELNFFLNLIET